MYIIIKLYPSEAVIKLSLTKYTLYEPLVRPSIRILHTRSIYRYKRNQSNYVPLTFDIDPLNAAAHSQRKVLLLLHVQCTKTLDDRFPPENL